MGREAPEVFCYKVSAMHGLPDSCFQQSAVRWVRAVVRGHSSLGEFTTACPLAAQRAPGSCWAVTGSVAVRFLRASSVHMREQKRWAWDAQVTQEC